MKSTSKGYVDKAQRLAAHVIQEIRQIEPGAAEAMEFWRDKSHKHYLYFRARRDLMRDIRRVISIAILKFFTREDIDTIEKNA